MEKVYSKESRRGGVLVNYGLLLLAAAVFCIGEYGTWNVWLTAIELISLIGLAASFNFTFRKSGIWKFFHTDPDDLDEREIVEAHKAFQSSYRLFTAITMFIIVFVVVSVRFEFLTLTWRGHYSIGIMLLFAMNYLVHTLPSTVYAWKTERLLVDPSGE